MVWIESESFFFFKYGEAVSATSIFFKSILNQFYKTIELSKITCEKHWGRKLKNDFCRSEQQRIDKMNCYNLVWNVLITEVWFLHKTSLYLSSTHKSFQNSEHFLPDATEKKKKKKKKNTSLVFNFCLNTTCNIICDEKLVHSPDKKYFQFHCCKKPSSSKMSPLLIQQDSS